MVFKLFSTLASNSDVDPRDVRNVKSYLGDSGFIKSKKQYDPYPNSELFGGIKKFQRKNGLKVDGVIKPNGETATQMAGLKGPIYICPGLPEPYMIGGCDKPHGMQKPSGLCPECHWKGVDEGIIEDSDF